MKDGSIDEESLKLMKSWFAKNCPEDLIQPAFIYHSLKDIGEDLLKNMNVVCVRKEG